MDNPLKGEVSFEADDKTYTLIFSNNAFCALEKHLDCGIFDIYDEIASWSPKTDGKGKPLPETKQETEARARRIRLGFCRALFWAGLNERHPEITLEEAGRLMTAAGGLIGVMNLIATGVAAAQPKAEPGGVARPEKRARRGTGSPS